VIGLSITEIQNRAGWNVRKVTDSSDNGFYNFTQFGTFDIGTSVRTLRDRTTIQLHTTYSIYNLFS
jgi:hypothetical protein